MQNNLSPDNNKWPKEIFFVFACVGAAVGLGNLWRFPYVAYENGGSAFFFPYIVCLLLVGLPITFLEIGLGRWSEGSIASAFKKVNKRWTWIGWWALANSMVIVFYYSVVLAWCVQFFIYSFTEAWGNDPSDFFMSKVLNISDNLFSFGKINFISLIALFVVWATIFFIVRSSIRSLSKVLLVTVPLPLIILLILAGRSLNMPGATDGIQFFLKPQINRMFNVSVWAAAASQVILSIGIGMGQMVAYSSKKRNDENIIKSGISICFLDLFFSFIAGITVFATMGFLANTKGVPFSDLKLDGIFLAFVSYPMAISSLPLAPIWGICFFILLISLGIDSAFAAIEANLVGLEDLKLKSHRSILALVLCSIGFLGGIIFITRSGLYWLDIVDHWVANYAIASIVILQCIVFGNIAPIKDIALRIKTSWTKYVYNSWKILISYIIPLILLIIFGGNFIKEFGERYSGYPIVAIMIGGWGICILVIVIAIYVAHLHNRKS